MAHHYIPIVFAGTSPAARTRGEIVAYLPEVRPSWFFAVPRIWEKLKAGLEAMLAAQPEEQRAPSQAALEASLQRGAAARSAASRCPRSSASRVAQADADDVLQAARDARPRPGCWRSTSARRRRRVEVLEFFHAIGIELAELWGMSETCGVGTFNPPERGQDRHGRPAVAGRRAQARRGRRGARAAAPFVMRGYRNLPGADRRGARRRRLAAHRRHRRRSTRTAT